MSNDNEYNDLDIDQKNEEEVLDEVDSPEQEETEADDSGDNELEKLRSENKKLAEIIRRRKEKEAKAPAPETAKPLTTNSQTSPSREEVLLIAQGYTEDDLDYLNGIAKGFGLPLKDAKEHPVFVSYLEQQEATKKAKKATMGASKGSPTKKTVDVGGLSDDEHRKVWLEKIGMSQ